MDGWTVVVVVWCRWSGMAGYLHPSLSRSRLSTGTPFKSRRLPYADRKAHRAALANGSSTRDWQSAPERAAFHVSPLGSARTAAPQAGQGTALDGRRQLKL